MADEAARDPGPFDVATVDKLVRLMARHDLNEILLEQGDARIRLRRGFAAPIVAAPPVLSAASAPSQSAPTAPASQPAALAKVLHDIKSPSVGIFYRAQNPDAEPFVKLGSRVTPETVTATDADGGCNS